MITTTRARKVPGILATTSHAAFAFTLLPAPAAAQAAVQGEIASTLCIAFGF